MNSIVKKFSTACVAGLIALSTAACGGGTSGGGTSAGNAGGDAAPASENAGAGQQTQAGGGKSVELLTWTNEPTVNFLNKIAAGFHEAYPDYALSISNIPSGDHDSARETRISAGNIDIVSFQTFALPQLDWNQEYVDKPTWQQYIDEGLLLDISDQDFVKRYSVDALAGNTYNGKYYSICEGTVAYTGLFYNKAIFDELSLTPPSTWAELAAICEKIKADGKYKIMTSGAADTWPLNMFVNAIFSANFTEEECSDISKRLLTGELKHTDPELAVIYDCVEQMSEWMEPGVTGVNYSDAPGRFAVGDMAMYADGSWTAPTIEAANPDLKFGYFSVPGVKARADGLIPQLGIKYDLSFSIPSNAPNKDGALAFLEYFSRKEIYTDFLNSVGGFSSTQPNITLENEFLNSLSPALEKPHINPEFLIYGLKGVGEYGAQNGFSFFYLKTLGGPFTKEELAQAASEDYETARAAIQKLNN